MLLVHMMDAEMMKRLDAALKQQDVDISLVVLDEAVDYTPTEVRAMFHEYGRSTKTSDQGGEIVLNEGYYESIFDDLADQIIAVDEAMTFMDKPPPHGHSPYHIENGHKRNARRRK